MKTTAAVLRELGAPLSIEELLLPELKSGQVLVQIAYSGVCHTQLSEASGRKGPDRFLPHALGHEGAGIVIQTGSAVTKVRAGDHVVMTWIKGDGLDEPQTLYGSVTGQVNSGAVTTFQHHAVVSENRLVPIPKDMPLREAALLGCAVSTGAGMVLNTLDVQAGESVVIFGAGGIGMSALLAAAGIGASPIIVVDVVESRLAQAKALGATHTVNASKTDAVTAVREITGGAGAKHAVECAGRKETMEASLLAVRNGDGTTVLAGNLGHGEKIEIDPFELIRGKRILGSWGGATKPDRDIPRFVEMYRQGKLPLEKLIDREYSLDRVNEALESLKESTVGRAIITLS